MKRNLLILFLLMTFCRLTYGQGNGNHWDVNNNQWSMTMSIIAVVNVDGEELRTNDIEIACFNGEELRSDGVILKYEEEFNRYIAYLYPRGDEPYTLTFKLYDHGIGEELDYSCMTSIQYTINGTIGEVNAPYAIDFKSPVTFTGDGSWNDASNWNNATIPAETDDVTIDGDVLISGEVTVNSLIINEGKSLTIQDGGKLNVTGNLRNSDYDALIIEDGGQIIQNNKNVAATFKKNIVNPSSWSNPVSGWQFISSPMIDAATSDFASSEGDYDLYKFDGSQELQWVNYKNHDDFEESFTLGIGYIASYQSQETSAFKGELNNETEYFEFEIGFDADNEWANFYLLGNPFSFDIDWYDMIYNPRRVQDGFATLDASTGSYKYNVDEFVKVGEGFMIYTFGAKPSLEYESSSKSRRTKSEYIGITVSNSNGSDNVIINNVENESVGFPKLDNINPNIANIYVKKDDRRYGIFNHAESEEIPLHFDAKEMGNYTLTFDINGDYDYLYLLDKMTGEKVNVLIEDEYSFIANSNDNTERFIISFAQDSQLEAHSNFAFIDNGELIINAEGTIQIIDMMGRIVMTEENHNGSINIGELNNAAYLIRCINENGVKVQKIVVY